MLEQRGGSCDAGRSGFRSTSRRYPRRTDCGRIGHCLLIRDALRSQSTRLGSNGALDRRQLAASIASVMTMTTRRRPVRS